MIFSFDSLTDNFSFVFFSALCTNKRGLKQIMPELGETLSFKNHQKQYLSELTGFYGKNCIITT